MTQIPRFLKIILASVASYAIARYAAEGLNTLSPHSPIGAGVVAGMTAGYLFHWYATTLDKDPK